MKGYAFIVCFILVLLMAAVPVTATSTTSTTKVSSTDSITTISPAVAETSDTVTVTITGVNFSVNTGSVWLEKSDESNIDATIISWTYNTIKCSIKTKSTTETGKWNVVVGKDAGGYTTIVKTGGFSVTKLPTVTSITPESGQVDDDVDFTIAGKDFDEDMDYEVFLYNTDYDNITADSVDVDSSTKISGTFDLSDADDDTYDVCIEDEYGAVKCKKNAFKVVTNAEGTIEISSSPSGATIYIDDITNGTTPRNVNILIGSHKVTLKKAGYSDWAKIVNVEEDETTEVDATLYAVATATPTTQPTAVPTTARTATSRTTVKSTMKIPTTYADPVTTTAASPVDPALIIGTICLAFIALRKN
jgi:hypothetical protein